MSLVACVHIPSFAIALARRETPALADTPLVLYTRERQRSSVYAACVATGIAPGTPLHQARVRCPNACFLRANTKRDTQVLTALITLLESASPRVAALATPPDCLLALDLGRQTLPEARTTARHLIRRIQGTFGLTPAIGIASTRFVAQHAATAAAPGDLLTVAPGDEAAFLAPLPAAILPAEAETQRRLTLLGLRTVGDVARLSLDALQVQFGREGQRLFALAHGRDETTLGPNPHAPELSCRLRFNGPLSDQEPLDTAIARLSSRLAAQLQGCSARAVRLTLDLTWGAPWAAERVLPEPTTDAARLTHTFLALRRTADIAVGVEALTLAVTEITPLTATQLDLFATAQGQRAQLRETVARLKRRYAHTFLRASLPEPTAQRPESRVRFESFDLS